jgi:hypothetical protein
MTRAYYFLKEDNPTLSLKEKSTKANFLEHVINQVWNM